MSRVATTGKPIPVRLPLSLDDRLRAHLSSTGTSPTEAMRAAVELLLSAGDHARLADAPLPTESERANKRIQCLAVLKRGVSYTPAEIGRLIGCCEAAAGAYCRDNRKNSYGAHNVKSKPVIVDGRRTSVYWLEVE